MEENDDGDGHIVCRGDVSLCLGQFRARSPTSMSALSRGGDDGHIFKVGPTVWYCVTLGPEPFAVRLFRPVSSQGRMLSSRSDLPPGGEKNRRRWRRGVLHREDVPAVSPIFWAPSVIIGARPLMWSGGTVVRSTWEALATVCCYAREGGPTVCVRPPWPRSGPGRVGHSLGPPCDDRGRGWGQSLGVDPPQNVPSSQRPSTPEKRKSLSTSSSGWEIYLPTSYIPGCSIALGDRK